MNNKQLIEAGMEIQKSLDDALRKAGGDFTLDELKEISAYDFISILSTNNIRFTYIEQNQKVYKD